MKRWHGLIVLSVLFVLSGCEDMIELEKEAFVIALGIDQTDEDGIYEFTFQFANPNISDTEMTSENEEDEIVSVLGSDIMSAKDRANTVVTKRVSLDHLTVFIVSEELAKSGEFLNIIQPASRTSHMRHDIQIIVSKEKAEVFLANNDPTAEQKPYKYFQHKIGRVKETGIIPEADLYRFFQITEGDAGLFLAIYATTIPDIQETRRAEDAYIAGERFQKGGNPTQLLGSAVFKEGTMIDILNGEETRIANLLNNTVQLDAILTTYIDPLNPDYFITGNYIQRTSPDIDVQYDAETNHASIDITILFEFEILAIPSLIRYIENEEYKDILEKALVKYNTLVSENLVKKTQEEYSTDPFYWSLYIRRFFKDIPSFEEADWNKNIYPNADITVTFKLNRLQFGKTLTDTNLHEVRD